MISYIEQLKDFLDKYNISPSDICIGGSSVLSAFGLKTNNDLDIIIKHVRRKKIKVKNHHGTTVLSSGTICYKNIQSCIGRYEAVGISDDEMINNKDYYFFHNGWKCAKIEIEIAAKIKKNRKKDVKDVKNTEEFLSNNPDFDWDLFRKCLARKQNKTKQNKIKLRQYKNIPSHFCSLQNLQLKRFCFLLENV